MLKQVEIEKINTLQITSKYSAFTGSRYTWQEAYFQILSHQNTYGFAYQTNIESTHDHEAYLWILLRPTADKTRIIDWLEDLGYGKISVDKVVVGEMDTYDLDVDFITEA